MCGVLFWSDLDDRSERTSRISSNAANMLVGAIYLPRGTLIIDANAPVADLSARTAVIVRQFVMSGRPHLVINLNYNATDVPAPSGIRLGRAPRPSSGAPAIVDQETTLRPRQVWA